MILANALLAKVAKKLRQLWRYLWRHKVLVLIFFALPLLLAWFIYAVFYASLPRELPIGVVDFDKTPSSKQALFMVDSAPAVQIMREYSSISEAKSDLAMTRIYALLIIPESYEAHLKRGIEAKLTLYYNAQFVLIGKAIASAMTQVVGTLNAKQWSAKNLVHDENLALAISKSLPIFSQIIPLYNSSNNYTQFMLTLLLPCMLQILSALGMIHLLKSPPTNAVSLLARYLFVTLVFGFWGLCMLVLLRDLGYEVRGSFGLLCIGVLLLLACVNAVVVFVQSVLLDMKKAIGFLAIYTAPSLAFAGVTYPQASMNALALFWSKFLPISYYMQLYIQQANYGGTIAGALAIMGEMLWFLLFLALGGMLYHLRVFNKSSTTDSIRESKVDSALDSHAPSTPESKAPLQSKAMSAEVAQ